MQAPQDGCLVCKLSFQPVFSFVSVGPPGKLLYICQVQNKDYIGWILGQRISRERWVSPVLLPGCKAGRVTSYPLGHCENYCCGGSVYFVASASMLSYRNDSKIIILYTNTGREQKGCGAEPRVSERRGFHPQSDTQRQDTQVSTHQAPAVARAMCSFAQGNCLAPSSCPLQLNSIYHLIPPVQRWHDLSLLRFALGFKLC